MRLDVIGVGIRSCLYRYGAGIDQPNTVAALFYAALKLQVRLGSLPLHPEPCSARMADPNAEDWMGCRPLVFALANDAEEHACEGLRV